MWREGEVNGTRTREVERDSERLNEKEEERDREKDEAQRATEKERSPALACGTIIRNQRARQTSFAFFCSWQL